MAEIEFEIETTGENADNEIYINLFNPKASSDGKGLYGDHFISYEEGGAEILAKDWRRKLLRTKNPLAAAPQSRTKCVKWFKTKFPPIKTCIGWKTEWRYMYTTATLVVVIADGQDIRKEVEDCLRDAAIAAAVAAILAAIATGGAALGAAIDLFVKLFTACLAKKLGTDLVSIRIDMKNEWGDWE